MPSKRSNVGMVVADMQPGFGYAVDMAMNETLKQLELARKRRSPISIVQLNPKQFKPTHERIKEALHGYDLFQISEKQDQDGSQQIHNWFEDIKFKPKKLRICGVYRNACVASTARGLAGIYKHECEIILINKACCESADTDEKLEKLDLKNWQWEWLKNFPQIKVSHNRRLYPYPRKAS